MTVSDFDYLTDADEIVEEFRRGRMVILVDDEGRENEGDLVIPAELADAEAINFMAKNGRGLICLAMTAQRVHELDLPLMARTNESRHQTAFTVSIEARQGVTTGISAADRAQTIKVAIDPAKGKSDIGSPGHVFPLIARDGGVLVRAGHTEASVDLARMAGYKPAGVICEIMNDDGTMARLPDLVKFAQFHNLKIATIADLIAHRRRTETIVKRTHEIDFESRYGGDFRLIVYVNQVEYAEHIALVKGDVTDGGPVHVRMHSLNVLADLLGDQPDHGSQLHAAMTEIGRRGRGVVVLIREARPTALSDIVERRLGVQEKQTVELRDYGTGAQILLDLGVKDMILLSNSTRRNIVGLEGYGLSVSDVLPIPEAKGNASG